ncbi:hypothetical protein GGI12_001535 [Dipsacomyces acuminosporus]|nr:hypothetical protein GGI12_001535 [Dipsacomyces acuminosporus]
MACKGVPKNYTLASQSTSGTFTVCGLPPRTHIDRIYMNGLHTLLPFWVTNNTGQTLEIGLSSTVDSTLKFHTQNPNWDPVPGEERESYIEVVDDANGSQDSSAAAGETTLICNASMQKDFNEVFNQMGGVDNITIPPHETKEIILLFMATGQKRSLQTPVPSRRPSLGQISSHSAATSNVGASESTPGPHAAMDPPTSRIYLDDCVIGRLYERSLRIKNASSIGLDWTNTILETTDSTSLSSLQLLDSDMHPLSGGHLAGHTSKTLIIRYTPQAVGEFLCRFLIENSNDSSNQRYWVFRARASQRQKPKRVDLLSDPDINFGDCTSGVWYHKEVSFKNVSDTPILMRFRVEGNVANLTMKSSVKARQDAMEDAESGIDQQLAVDTEQSTASPAHMQSDLRSFVHSETSSGYFLRDDDAGSTNNDDSQSNRVSLHSGYMQTSNLANDQDDDVISEGGHVDVLRSIGDKGDTAPTSLQRAGSVSTQSTFSKADMTDDGAAQNAASTRRDSERYLPAAKDPSRRSMSRIRANASHSHQPTLFDEVLIKPGAIRSIVFSLMGNSASSGSFNASQFVRQSFTLFCEYSIAAANKQPSHIAKGTSTTDKNTERLSLPCTLNMCTPFVRVTPALLDFGSVDVGMLKSMYIQVENLSQVEATVQCRLESKVINCIRTPVVIPPLQTQSIRVDIYPRRTNARYRKQIIVRNKHNLSNDNVIEVRSVHVDQRRMAYHNLFYKTLVPENEQNFVDFGAVPINTRILRKINLKNLCRCPITLELSASDSSTITGSTGSSGSAATAADLDTCDNSVMALYTIVPLTRQGAITEEARRVSQQLPLLERQAVMHSNIERFKEHAGVIHAVPEQQRSQEGASSLLSQSSLPPSMPQKDSLGVLQPDMFVDKSVEKGHVCLLPFVRGGSVVTRCPSIDYLDAAVGTKPRSAVIRIREVEHRTFHSSKSSGRNAGGSPSIADSHATSAPTAASADSFNMDDAATTAVINRACSILDEIVNHLDMAPQTMFSSPRAEDEYVRRQVDLHKYIDLLIESGFLQPAHHVMLPSSSVRPVIVMFRPSESTGTSSDKPISPRFDANLYFNLANSPSDLLPYTESASSTVFANSYQLPVRRFLVQASLCRSEFGIGQKSINVGNMQVDETSRKYLLIQNRAETPLMYAIRKTGSIASGDIQFVDNNRYGVVRGFDSRKIVFVFSPSLTGVYNEQISISNVLNILGGKTATLKAVVRRPSKFYIQSLRLEFCRPPAADEHEADGGSVTTRLLRIGQRSDATQVLVIKNMTAKRRHFVVRPFADEHAYSALSSAAEQQQQMPAQPEGMPNAQQAQGGLPTCTRLTLDPLFPEDAVSALPPAKVLDRETEEKIESLEQKLKIAVRKNKPEKIEKYRGKLAKLRSMMQGSSSTTEALASNYPGTLPHTGASAMGTQNSPAWSPALATVKRLEGDKQLLVTLPGNADVSIPVVVVPRLLDCSSGRADELPAQNAAMVEGRLVVHEEKDKDNIKIVTLVAPVALEPTDTLSQAEF